MRYSRTDTDDPHPLATPIFAVMAFLLAWPLTLPITYLLGYHGLAIDLLPIGMFLWVFLLFTSVVIRHR